jgi:serine/threonine-protein kinase
VRETQRWPELVSGSLIAGRYRLEKLIGEGGMGAVWSARHLGLEVPVAIKLLHPGPEMDKPVERFKFEARAAAQLSHPAIVRVLDIDANEAGEPFIVMELLQGESLAERIERGPLSGIAAVQLLLPIVEALVLAHSKGIVHRDLKPLNIFLARDGELLQPKLLDFGIAKLLMPPLAGSLTDTGALVGSPEYMSPEQARGRNDVDHRADIWSLSVVLYEALSGDIPFKADNYNAMLRAIVEDEPPPLLTGQDADRDLARLVLRGLAKDPAARPQSMFELGHELARWLLDRGVVEDVCGTSLASRWMNGAARRPAATLIGLSASAATAALDSAHSHLSRDDPSSPPSLPEDASPSGPRITVKRPWARTAGAVALITLLAALGILALARSVPRATRVEHRAPTVAPERAPASSFPTIGSEIAAVPTAVIAIAPPPSSSAPQAPAEQTTRRAIKAKGRPIAPSSEPPQPSALPKPTRDEETRELLQAY